MTKEQARKEAISIIEAFSEKCDMIRQEAKKSETWQMGLDSNRELFREAEKEMKDKLKQLASEVDKE